jgi:hypothetical protein
MKNTALALVLLLAACAVPPGAHDAGEQGGDTTVFVEDHHQKKDAAFLAAAGWFSEHYKGGRDAVQLSDKGSGTIIAKGACRWSKPVDSFQLHFHEGWAEYSLKVKVSDDKVEMEFKTGEVYGDGEHGPKDLMPQLLPCYQSMRTGIMKAISEKGEQ